MTLATTSQEHHHHVAVMRATALTADPPGPQVLPLFWVQELNSLTHFFCCLLIFNAIAPPTTSWSSQEVNETLPNEASLITSIMQSPNTDSPQFSFSHSHFAGPVIQTINHDSSRVTYNFGGTSSDLTA